MSSKHLKKKKQQESAGLEITGQLAEYFAVVLLFLIGVVLPLYVKNGYYEIGAAKFAAYKNIMFICMPLLCITGVIYFAMWLRQERKKGEMGLTQFFSGLSVTDYFVIAYLVCVILSVFAGGFYQKAFWGYAGWNMGLFSQISFVLIYFIVSRFGRYYKGGMWVICGASVIVFLFGVLHRLLIDPLGYYENIEAFYKGMFLSTLGQSSWYGSYMSVILPLGIAAFILCKNRIVMAISGLYTFLGFCTLVTQNSDSAYFALIGFMLVLFWCAVAERELLLRFFVVTALFFGAGKVMHFMLLWKPNPNVDVDWGTRLIQESAVTWVFLAVSILFCGLLSIPAVKEKYPADAMKIVRKPVLCFVAVCIVCMAAIIVLNANGHLPQTLVDKLSGISYFTWNDNWGNGRGRTWAFTVRMFSEEGMLNKLFGVGPDCYFQYANGHYAEELRMMWGDNALTNAHNEWLNILINAGIFGVVSYLGIFLSSVKRFMKERDREIILVGIAACIVSYMVYDFFCYQEVLCTPYVFIWIGMGEYILRKSQ